MALHVDGDNEGAIALYEGRGYARAVEREVDDAFGRASRALGGLWGGKKTKKILMWKWLIASSRVVARDWNAMVLQHYCYCVFEDSKFVIVACLARSARSGRNSPARRARRTSAGT